MSMNYIKPFIIIDASYVNVTVYCEMKAGHAYVTVFKIAPYFQIICMKLE